MRQSAFAFGAALLALAVASRAGTTRSLDVAVRGRPRARRHGPRYAGLQVVKAIGQPWLQLSLSGVVALKMRRDGLRGGRVVFTSVGAAFIGDRIIKRIVGKKRPPTYRGANLFHSFPSGHTAAATAFSWSVARALEAQGIVGRSEAFAVASAVTAGMAASRIALDEHWITDVIGGALLGAAIVALNPMPKSR